MRAPEFWRADGAAARLLSPLGAIYGRLAQARLARSAPRAAAPTIIIGGLTAGGDGKTPLVLALTERLLALGERPVLLTRGYGRTQGHGAPLIVDARHTAEDVGDEALLLSRATTTIVGADRLAGAALALELGASVIMLDDGFHSRQLVADLVLLAVDSDFGAGNRRCLPAGPLRAPLDAQLSATDALVVVGDGAPGVTLARESGKTVFSAEITPDRQAAFALSGARVVAFAGIARPGKFFRTLRETGAEIVASRRFDDHHRFTGRDYATLMALRSKLDATLVTTEKDFVRLGSAASDGEVTPLPVRLVFDDPAAIDAMLSASLVRARISRAS